MAAISSIESLNTQRLLLRRMSERFHQQGNGRTALQALPVAPGFP
jgi:hypothetical protein